MTRNSLSKSQSDVDYTQIDNLSDIEHKQTDNLNDAKQHRLTA